MPSDPAVRGFVLGFSSHLLSVDMNTLLQLTDDLDFADMNNNFHHLKCLFDHLFLCESRLARLVFFLLVADPCRSMDKNFHAGASAEWKVGENFNHK